MPSMSEPDRAAIIAACDRLRRETEREWARALLAGSLAAYEAGGAADRPAGRALLAMLRDATPYPAPPEPLPM